MQKNNETLVTVLIPVYNMEKYVAACIESIIEQSYKNLEIIIVNDGSTDSSEVILEEYAKKDDRIRVITTKNNGLSAARNIGIKEGRGEYIAFVDADDFVSRNYVKTLLSVCEEYKVPISQCYYYNVDYQCFDYIFDDDEDNRDVRVYDGRDMVLNLYNHMMLPSTLTWTKLYKKDIFRIGDNTLDVLDDDNLAFPEGRIYEDDYVSYRIFHKAGKIGVVNKKLYAYRKTPGSITNGAFNTKGLDLMSSLEERMRYYTVKKDRGLLELTYRRYYYELCRTIYKVKQARDNISNWQSVVKELNKKKRRSLIKIFKVVKFEDKGVLRTQLIKLKCLYKLIRND